VNVLFEHFDEMCGEEIERVHDREVERALFWGRNEQEAKDRDMSMRH